MQNVLSIVVPSMVSIIGFIVSIYLIKSEYASSIKVQQSNFTREKLEDVLIMIDVYTKAVAKNNKKDINKLNEISISIYPYGSAKSAIIIAEMINAAYTDAWKKEYSYEFYVLANMAVLVSQIKYDLTGMIINPSYWLKMKFKDYNNEEKAVIDNIINEIIDKFKLLEEFKISEKGKKKFFRIRKA